MESGEREPLAGNTEDSAIHSPGQESVSGGASQDSVPSLRPPGTPGSKPVDLGQGPKQRRLSQLSK